MITDVEEFFSRGCGRCDRFATPDCSTRSWLQGLTALRRICLDAGLVETCKWGHPCYMHAGRNIAIMGAFRGDFRLTFFNAALLTDPKGILERQGEGTRAPDLICFSRNARVAELAEDIARMLQEAMGHAEAGRRPPKPQHALELPDELAEALEVDPALGDAFNRLTPGRQSSYVINLASAKKPETRVARIARFRDRILAGKGALER